MREINSMKGKEQREQEKRAEEGNRGKKENRREK